MSNPILFVNACVRTESRTRIIATGLDIVGADVESILADAEKSVLDIIS